LETTNYCSKAKTAYTVTSGGYQIRSYVLDDRRVKDHRTGHQTSQTDAVLDGDLDNFLKAFLMYHGEPVPEDD
jgi:peptide chain release factor 2